MNKRILFKVVQLIAFIVVTTIAATIIICFPNPPSFVRQWINEHRIILIENRGKLTTVDKRFLKWFNRDPERHIPKDKHIIVSPADGILEKIIRKGGRIHLVIEMRYTDVHVQRVPISGKVLSIEGGGLTLQKGFNIMDYELKKMMPFQKVTTLKTEIGIVRVRQITSFFAKRIRVFLKPGQFYPIGTRLGNVLAGSTVVLDVPDVVKIIVKEQQEMIAGETIVARY